MAEVERLRCGEGVCVILFVRARRSGRWLAAHLGIVGEGAHRRARCRSACGEGAMLGMLLQFEYVQLIERVGKGSEVCIW